MVHLVLFVIKVLVPVVVVFYIINLYVRFGVCIFVPFLRPLRYQKGHVVCRTN
jgi:hypothetical protein